MTVVPNVRELRKLRDPQFRYNHLLAGGRASSAPADVVIDGD
jgi:hypothetical protein